MLGSGTGISAGCSGKNVVAPALGARQAISSVPSGLALRQTKEPVSVDLLVSRVQLIFSLGDGFRQARTNHGNFGRGRMRGILVTSFPTQQLGDVFRVWPQVGMVANFTILNVEICGFLFLFFLSGFVFKYMGLQALASLCLEIAPQVGLAATRGMC